MGNNIPTANSRQSHQNSKDISSVGTSSSQAPNDAYHHSDEPSLIGLSISASMVEESSSLKHGSDIFFLNSGSYKSSVIPTGRPKSLRANKPKDGIAPFPGRHDPLTLEVPESNEEIPPSPEMSPLPKNPGRFSPFLSSHFAAPVPDKALFGRAPFQSPITNKISGPFRLSSPLKSNSPLKKMPRPNSFGSNSKGFQGSGIAANSPHI